MILKKIDIVNFRNYDSISLVLNPRLNIFLGKNGMGKTNILEAVYFLAITKSHRSSFDKKLIKIDKVSSKIKGTVQYEQKMDKNLEILLTPTNKVVKIDNNEIKKLSDYISNLNVIVFSPETIDLLKGSPNIRRRFFNIEIGQINYMYLKQLSTYNNLLKTRNEYLKNVKSKKHIDEVYFDIITNKLIENAIYIYQNRQKFVEKINLYIDFIYKKIADKGDLRLKYLVNFDNYENETIELYLKNKYRVNFNNEVEQGSTLFGPHRDDFLFVLNGKDLKSYGSQGQQRMALLALKLAEVKIFREETNTTPLLLLDDIFSELDKFKKKNILNYIEDDIQIIMTTTDINKRNISNANIYTVENGSIIKYEEVN